MRKMKRNGTTSKLGDISFMTDELESSYLIYHKPFTDEQAMKIERAWSLIADVFEQHTGQKRRPLHLRYTPPSDGLH